MTAIKSKLISGIVGNEIANQKFRNAAGIKHDADICYMVFETKIGKDIYYCCWSGGSLNSDNSDVSLTEIGKAAFDVLMALPVGNNDQIIFQELRIGKTSLKKKVISMFQKRSPGSKICFFGDMSGELDGHMHKAFNLQGHKKMSV